MSQPSSLDLELLRALVAVAEQGSFAAAGARLGRSQAAISQQMQRLEQQVGSTLLVLEGRSKQLTEAGRELLRYARELLALNDEALHALQDRGLQGVLRIGSPHDVADTLLPPLLSHIARSSPRLRLEINVGRSPHLMESLWRGELDMTLSTREDPRLEGFVLRSSPTVWLSAARFALPPGQPLPLILIDEPSIFRRLAIEALDRQHLPWRQAYSCSSLIGVKAALRAGLGVTARSIELLGPDLRVLGEKEGLPRLPELSYHLWVRPHSANPLVRQAFDLIRRKHGQRIHQRSHSKHQSL